MPDYRTLQPKKPGRTLQPQAKEDDSGGGIQPLRLAFGSMSLVVGVQVICLAHIITGIFILACCTSVGSIKLVGIEIPPWKQVVGATWCLVGMPIIIQGGVGALYRVQTPVMNYFYYLLATCALDVAFLLSIFYESDMCTTVVPSEYVNMGSHFVCGMADSVLFLGFLFGLLIFLYFCFIVWSCAQEISGNLIRLREKLPEYEDEEEDLEPNRGFNPGYGMSMAPGMDHPTGPPVPHGFQMRNGTLYGATDYHIMRGGTDTSPILGPSLKQHRSSKNLQPKKEAHDRGKLKNDVKEHHVGDKDHGSHEASKTGDHGGKNESGHDSVHQPSDHGSHAPRPTLPFGASMSQSIFGKSHT